MLQFNESKLLYPPKKRKKGKQGPIIAAIFVIGLVLIIAAIVSDNRDDEPEAPDSMLIKSHPSALPEGEDFAPLGEKEQVALAPEKPVNTSKVNEKQAKAPKLKEPQPPKPLLETAPAQINTPANTAMYDFARQPTTPGAMMPQLGHYAFVDSPIKYDENASPEAIAAAQAKNYVVVSGDILGRIAQKHGCTIAQLQDANHLDNDQIKIGQKLLIPDCSKPVQPGAQTNAPSPDNPETPPVPSAQRGKWWRKSGINTTELPKLMAAEGFKPPQKFMALVIEFTFDDKREVITRERAFDYKGTSSLNSGWNPASTVKLFAAISALKRIDELGFSSRAKVTFKSKKNYSTTVGELIQAAIINSDNIAYDRVVQLASFDKLHTETLTAKFGITQTALNRAYEQTKWKSLGENPSLRVSPEIVLTEGKKSVKLPAVSSKAPAVCSSGACTSLQDLAESTRRLMLQEQLPEAESFNLKREDLLVLRRAMRSADRTRGTQMVDRFAEVFKDSRVKFYSKPGFSEDWFTDNAYIFDPRFNQAWIVVMSGYPGRSSLNSAATAIANIIASGKLRKIQ